MYPYNEPDLFERLAKERPTVLLYGMGNGADKIIAALEAKSIPVAGVFASDGFVRGQIFHGMRVMSFSEVKAAFDPADTVILLSFGSSRPEVLETIRQVAAAFPLLVPDLPVCGGDTFDAAMCRGRRDELEAARALFCDAESKALYDKIVRFRLNGSLELLLEAVSTRDPLQILKESPITVRKMADFGAYNGDSAREALTHFDLDFILAAEPDARNFKKLSAWSETVTSCEVECHRVAVCDRVGEAAFDDSGNRNAGLCTGRSRVTVPTATPDSLLVGRDVDYIKYDIEGAEAGALRGSADCIRRCRPALRVALYHRGADLFELPLLVSALCEDYRFYLTRAAGVPAWDIDLVAVPK